MSSSKKPDLKTYLNVHQYLQDLYQFRKESEEFFSYESWSQELGIRNRSFLRQIVIGRRALTEETTQIFCDRLCLEGVDRQYFEILVKYSKGGPEDKRRAYGRQLMQLLKSEYEQKEIENYYSYVECPLNPKILNLLTFKDIPRNAAALAELLNVSLEEIEKGLAILKELNLVEWDDTAQEWRARNVAVKVPDHVGDAALLDYHVQSLQEAIQAKNQPRDQRRYKALLMPLNAAEFNEFLGDLQIFVREALRKFDRDDLRGRKLHQVNFNIYAVSEEPMVEVPETSSPG